VVVVVTVAMVAVVVVGERDLLVQPLVTKVLGITLMVVLGMVVVVVVVMMVVVVVVVVVVLVAVVLLEVMLDFVLEALVHELLEFDTVLVVLDGTHELVVEMVLQPETGLVTLQLALESAEFRVMVVVVVAVTRVMTVVVTVVVRVVWVMHRQVSVKFLSGDLGDRNMGRLVVVVMTMTVMMGMNWQIGVVLPVRSDGIVTVVLNVTVVVGSSQGGGKAEDGNGDDLGLHFDCSFGFG
jgi:hypothetical protein